MPMELKMQISDNNDENESINRNFDEKEVKAIVDFFFKTREEAVRDILSNSMFIRDSKAFEHEVIKSIIKKIQDPVSTMCTSINDLNNKIQQLENIKLSVHNAMTEGFKSILNLIELKISDIHKIIAVKVKK